MTNSEFEREIKKKTVYIFDMDGTIVDLEELNYQGFRQASKRIIDLDVSRDDFNKYLSGTKTERGFTDVLKDRGIKPENSLVEKLSQEFVEIKKEGLNGDLNKVITVKPHVIDLFQRIRYMKYKMGLATSTLSQFTHIILDYFDLKKYFDVILTADDVTEGKPSPQMYNLAIEKLGAKKDDCVIFEDSLNGILSGLNAEVLCVGFHTKGLNDEFVNKADYVIDDYQQILDLLE